MLILLFYTLNILLLLSSFLHFRKSNNDENLSISLIQALFSLPLLACEYLYFAYHLNSHTGELIFFSEAVFILTWLSLARRLRLPAEAPNSTTKQNYAVEVIAGAVFLAQACYVLKTQLLFIFNDHDIFLPKYGAVYCLSILALLIVLYSSWKIEEFWRSIGNAERWRYKFLVTGSFLICGALAWSSSYKLTYMVIYKNHLFLLFALLCSGWALMAYDIGKHKLLKRKIFISRKVVYSFVVPSLLAVYFVIFGIITLTMNMFNLEMFFVVKWFLIATGIVGVMLFGFSGKIRSRSHFFISTHFYTNKYEYRDEWLSLSESLEGAQTEDEVVQSLSKILQKSLYTVEIFIWIGDSESGQDFTLSSWHKDFKNEGVNTINSSGILINYLKDRSYFHLDEKEKTPQWQEVKEQKTDLFESFKLKIITPISINNHVSGLIGLGGEYTGGEYSYDDFDLLSALGSQTAATLLAIRMSEKLAKAREQQAWNRLSAFVLHDIKNAATMLSLLQENAPEHIHEREFQDDMLELVDDTLKRMKRVEERLGTLKEDLAPNLQWFELNLFLIECSNRMMKKISTLIINVECPKDLCIKSDPELLYSIMENILLNASQAQDNTGVIQIKAKRETNAPHATLEIQDNGSGIEESLLPDALFEPFKTTKDGGSGIGLWQVKKIVSNMEGSIVAKNIPDGGAVFSIQLPLR
jgi:putative PEP-CTERM system histidine kinase